MSDSGVRVRPVEPADRDAVRDLALVNAMFTAEEMSGFDEMLSGHLDGSRRGDHWAVAELAGRVLGAAYWAPEIFGDRVWNLYFLAVDPQAHGQGVGTALVRHVLGQLRSAGDEVARILVVETSSADAYASARGFYAARGFDEEARIREFYGPGDDKVVFWQRVGS